MLYHSELNLISQLAALDLPTDPIALPDYSVDEMVNALLGKVDILKGDAAMSSRECSESLGLIKGNPRLTSLKVLAYTNQPENGLVAYCFSDLT